MSGPKPGPIISLDLPFPFSRRPKPIENPGRLQLIPHITLSCGLDGRIDRTQAGLWVLMKGGVSVEVLFGAHFYETLCSNLPDERYLDL